MMMAINIDEDRSSAGGGDDGEMMMMMIMNAGRGLMFVDIDFCCEQSESLATMRRHFQA